MTLVVSRAHGPLLVLLENYGLLDEIGSERLFGTNRAVEVAFHREHSQSA